MSDKPTAALQAYALEEKQHGSGYMTYYDKSMEPDADGEWLKRSDVEAKIRATEGQAQTSALALEPQPVARVTERSSFGPGIAFIANGKDLPRPGTLLYAAQLADSTAPGAPVRLTAEQIFNRAAPFFAWTKDGKECADWQKATQGAIGMPNLLLFVRALTDAAPTAQQSLTAGGAVPDERAAFEAAYLAEFGNPEGVVHDGVKLAWHSSAGVMWRAARRAAAPLPQVQSEAAQYRTGWQDGMQEAQELLSQEIADAARYQWLREKNPQMLCSIGWSTAGGEFDDPDQVIDAAINFDQQPVTPSGALADNDGGVA